MLTPALKLARNLFNFKHFDLVANFNVVVLHTDTTFHTVANFVNVVFKATQGVQLTFMHHHVITQYPW